MGHNAERLRRLSRASPVRLARRAFRLIRGLKNCYVISQQYPADRPRQLFALPQPRSATRLPASRSPTQRGRSRGASGRPGQHLCSFSLMYRLPSACRPAPRLADMAGDCAAYGSPGEAGTVALMPACQTPRGASWLSPVSLHNRATKCRRSGFISGKLSAAAETV